MVRFRNLSQGPTEDTLEQRFAPAVPGADDTRRAVLEAGARLERSLTAVVHREQARVIAKYGKGSAQAAQAAAATRAQAQGATVAAAAAQRGRAAPPVVDDNTVVVHGRAVDAARLGVPSLLATLVDDNGGAIARDKTDDNGYFRLEVRGTVVRTKAGRSALIVREPGATRPEPAPIKPGDGTGASDQPPPRTVRLVITRNEDTVAQDTIADLEPGEARYREIVIKDRTVVVKK
jgi:hypothetical protein